jgi:PAS domain S-box-containing protein
MVLDSAAARDEDGLGIDPPHMHVLVLHRGDEGGRIALLVRELGYAAERAAEPEDAARQLGARGFDLLIVDWSEHERGPGSLAALRAASRADVWVVALASRDTAERALDAGADDCLIGAPDSAAIALRLAVARRGLDQRRELDRGYAGIEARHRAIVQSAPIGIFEARADGTILLANDAFAKLVGRPHAEALVGESLEQVWPGALAAELWSGGGELRGGREVLRIPSPGKSTPERSVRLWTSGAPAGTVRGFVLDVTDTQRAALELRESLELNRRIMEVIPGGIVHVRADGSIVTANPEALRVLGLSFDDLSQRYVADFDTETIHEDGTPCGYEHYPVSRALATGEPQSGHTIGVRRPDGQTSWAVFTAVPLEDPASGGTAGAVVTFLDITERKRAERALAESEARYRELVETSPDPMAIVHEGKLVFVNAAGARLLGAESAASLLGAELESLVPPERRRALGEYTRRRLSGESLPPTEDRLLRRDGTSVDVEIAAASFAWSGKPAALFVARDLTERKRAEERLRELENKFQQTQKLESLGVLAGGIAHDFNNLLAAILGNASLARHQLPPGSAADESLSAIETASQRAADLTAQMLAYSGRGRFLVRPILLSDLVREMIELLSTVISKKAMLRCSFAHELPLIEGDPGQIQQVVMNLIVNASDALGDAPGTISVKTSTLHATRELLSRTYVDENLAEGRYAVLEVSDTGEGMDAATRERVFDPFFTTKTTGRGLGLAATLGIVRGHRGAVELESEPGRGTTFRIYFPVAESATREPSLHVVSAPPSTRQGTVLVIDDEILVLSATRQMLENAGFTVLCASGGREGISLFERHAAIDLVLLDMTMPDMSGAEVLAELRERRRDVRVLLCSGYSESEVVDRVGRDGVYGFLQKPYSIAALLAKLEQAIGSPSRDESD